MNTEKSNLTESKKPDAFCPHALARRQLLLKGLGKGSAVLAASIPLQTLASESVFTYNGSGSTATQIRCGISGMTSGIHSRDITTNQCIGYSPGYYHLREHFPASVNPDALITAVFSGCSLNVPNMVERCTTEPGHSVSSGKKTIWVPESTSCGMFEEGTRVPTLLEVMNITPRPNEFHWLAAWLNAQPDSPAINYPYSGAEIIAFYNNKDPQAFLFLTKYMEQHP